MQCTRQRCQLLPDEDGADRLRQALVGILCFNPAIWAAAVVVGVAATKPADADPITITAGPDRPSRDLSH